MIDFSTEDKAIIFLDGIQTLSYRERAEILKAISADLNNLEKAKPNIRSEVYALVLREYKDGALARYIKCVEDNCTSVVSIFSELYPEELKTIYMPPLMLYLKGNISLLKDRKFTIVGSRHSLPLALSKGREFAESLSEYFTIVTGLAEGGDTAAIKGALPSKKLISVIAGGFKHIYPAANRPLYEEIAKNALVISEYNPDVKVEARFFPLRNRILAGLSEGVLIISGSNRSGTTHTANAAVENGREVFAFPYNIGIESGEICNKLIKEGAYLCDNVVDILSRFNINLKIETDTQKLESGLSEDEANILALIKEKGRSSDELSTLTALPQGALSAILVKLEIKRYIVACSGNVYIYTK